MSDPCPECGEHHFGLRHGQWLRVRESVANAKAITDLVNERDDLREMLQATREDARQTFEQIRDWANLALERDEQNRILRDIARLAHDAIVAQDGAPT